MNAAENALPTVAWAHAVLAGTIQAPVEIVLASGSPRRSALLAQAGIPFTTIVSHADERLGSALAANPPEAAQELARRKARAVLERLKENAAAEVAAEGLLRHHPAPSEPGSGFAHAADSKPEPELDSEPAPAWAPSVVAVIGADTMVVRAGRIFGKPHDAEHAAWMLSQLSDGMHEVLTGVAVLFSPRAGSGPLAHGEVAFTDAARVTFRKLSAQEIADYLACGESLDKAGAYALQGQGARLVAHVEGARDTVIGLPVARLLHMLPGIPHGADA